MRKFYLILVCLIATLSSAKAQDYLFATGQPAYSTSLPIDQGIVNVNNGEIHLEIPLALYKQRGALTLDEKLVYDSRIWKIAQNGSNYSWQPTNVPSANGGWRFSSGTGNGIVSYSPYPGTDPQSPDCSGSGQTQSYTQNFLWYWADPIGTVHAFPSVSTVKYDTAGPLCTGTAPEGNATSNGLASDGSGYSIAVSNYTTAVITSLDGTTYYPSSGGNTTDRYGNYFSADASGNLIGSNGVAPVLTTTSGNQTTYSVIGVAGVRNKYTVTTTTVYFNTSFAESSVKEASGSFTAIQSIALPDGSSYQFAYDSGTSAGHYGELTSMTLPTGGVVSYGWSNYVDSFNNSNRWLTSLGRDAGSTVFTPTLISKCSSSAGCQESMSVQTPDNNTTVYTFNLDKTGLTAGSSWVQGIKSYQGSSSSGRLLRSTTTSYTYSSYSYEADENGTFYIVGSYQVPASTVTTVTLNDVGLSSQTTTTLDGSGARPADVKVWDFGTSTSGSPTRETVTTYGPGGQLGDVIVKDGSGNQISKVTYGYDETKPSAAPSGLPNYTSGVNGYGNQTSVHQWINTSGATLNQTMTYDAAGVMLSATDGNGNTTSFGHDSNDLCTTSTTRPTTNSVQHISSATCDASTGLLTSQTDENSKTTKYSSYDALNRLLQVNYPDGGLATFSYPSSTESIESHALTSSVSSKTTTTFDSYGRKSHVTVADPEGDDTVDYAYDTSGRLLSQSNPHRSSAATTDGTTTFGYDALGRLTLQTQPDASTKTWTYLGNTVTAKDEAGNQWKQTSDGFGRLTQVLEPSKTSQSPTVETDYAYNVFTTTVTQRGVSGESAHIRTFVTDSLGRPFTTTTPEAGVICYGTVSSGTCQSGGYDAAGNLTSKTDARGVKLSWSYDALNRPISETSSDNSISNSYSYDNTTVGSSGIGRLFGAFGSKASTGFYYDSMGRITGKSYFTPSTNAGSKRSVPSMTWPVTSPL